FPPNMNSSTGRAARTRTPRTIPRAAPTPASSTPAASNTSTRITQPSTARLQPTACRRSIFRQPAQALAQSDRSSYTSVPAIQKTSRKTVAEHAEDLRAAGASAYPLPADARIRRKYRAPEPDDGAKAPAAAQPEAPQGIASTTRSVPQALPPVARLRAAQ